MQEQAKGIGKLLDTLTEKMSLKNDAALSRLLEVAPPVISKLRSGMLPLGASMIIKMHLAADVPVRELQAYVAA